MHRSALVRRLVVVASMVVLVGAAASPAEALTAAPTITVTVAADRSSGLLLPEPALIRGELAACAVERRADPQDCAA